MMEDTCELTVEMFKKEFKFDGGPIIVLENVNNGVAGGHNTDNCSQYTGTLQLYKIGLENIKNANSDVEKILAWRQLKLVLLHEYLEMYSGDNIYVKDANHYLIKEFGCKIMVRELELNPTINKIP